MPSKRKKIVGPSAIFTVAELEHLRDLFGVILPTEESCTVSQALAIAEGREELETELWTKIASMCSAAEVALESDAPSHAIVSDRQPHLTVRRADHAGEPTKQEVYDEMLKIIRSGGG